jgi:DNA processing protein
LGDGPVVVSGLARGIDTAAHDGALETGTIAVIAGGIDIFYPPENEARQRAIGERGLLLAEQPPGTEPRARHFPYRNRIIAGLAGGTVVIEAAPKSGSLITARYAAEHGRDVMAVPGSPLDPRAQGCNQLIREGAVLVQNAADVLRRCGRLRSGRSHSRVLITRWRRRRPRAPGHQGSAQPYAGRGGRNHSTVGSALANGADGAARAGTWWAMERHAGACPPLHR